MLGLISPGVQMACRTQVGCTWKTFRKIAMENLSHLAHGASYSTLEVKSSVLAGHNTTHLIPPSGDEGQEIVAWPVWCCIVRPCLREPN